MSYLLDFGLSVGNRVVLGPPIQVSGFPPLGNDSRYFLCLRGFLVVKQGSGRCINRGIFCSGTVVLK